MSNATLRRMLMAALLVSVVPATGHAQKQWKPGERVPPLTIEELDDVIKRWRADLEYTALSEKEKTKRDEDAAAQQAALEAKKAAHDECIKNMSPDDAMALHQKMQARVMELAQSGDPNAATKAGKEMQDAIISVMAKKCGPEPKGETGSSLIGFSEPQYKLREWLQAYFAILAEKGAATAAEFVLATDEEVKLIESRMTQLKQLIATEEKLFKKS